jgi:hypothetical protein
MGLMTAAGFFTGMGGVGGETVRFGIRPKIPALRRQSEPQIALERYQVPAACIDVAFDNFRGDPAAVLGCFMCGQEASQLLPLFLRCQVQ